MIEISLNKIIKQAKRVKHTEYTIQCAQTLYSRLRPKKHHSIVMIVCIWIYWKFNDDDLDNDWYTVKDLIDDFNLDDQDKLILKLERMILKKIKWNLEW